MSSLRRRRASRNSSGYSPIWCEARAPTRRRRMTRASGRAWSAPGSGAVTGSAATRSSADPLVRQCPRSVSVYIICLLLFNIGNGERTGEEKPQADNAFGAIAVDIFRVSVFKWFGRLDF